MSNRALVVELEVMGEPVTGLWCPHCALPSAVAMVFGVRNVSDKGGSNLRLHVLYRCVHCGADR